MSAKVEEFPPQIDEGKQVKKAKTAYVRELKEELKKVTWTSREELFLCTKIVIGATFVLGLGIYFSDLCIKGALNAVAYVAHWIFG